ncbi:expressed unknown protein [Seminavis robusta]|uniref:RING-type domain-containing protein n=1 Tax=Seminavis robusta TaxID=568900 RepID=A0A9N8E7G4_9STRA|nr:expressed unknown protein [Seminavis robusta]|eukprot:Sro702_g189920.1 n/a (596) ;mRNA; f:19464-21357
MASQSAFSFHCMICFEEFHPDERYPVVLPCGHTYVCNLCGDRLDKCMECRTPLFISVPRPQNQPNTRTPSYRTPRQPPSPPMVPVKKRLPLPKNVVLLSLIEATELATEDATSKSEASPRNHKSEGLFDDAHHHVLMSPDDNSISAVVDADDLEEERIKLGTTMAVSVAGTYAVTDPKGMSIYPSRPSKHAEDAFRKDSSQHTSDEDVDKLVRYFHLDQKMDVDSTEDELKENRMKEQPPLILSCGDRVQVVAIEGGWAKLARGYGYVHADDNKLVKVGNSVDRACKLEAMLRSLSTQRKRLRLEQSKVDNMFIRLMNDLQISLMTDDDLTVIVADTFSQAPSERKVAEYRQQHEARDQMPTRQGTDASLSNVSNHGPVKPPKLPEHPQQEERQDSQVAPHVLTSAARGFACFANDMFDTISGTGSDETEFHKLRRQQGISPPTVRTASAQKTDIEATTCRIPGNVATTLFPSASHPSPSAMSAGARAWRELHGREECRGGVDFKTGMSGHMALLSSHAHPHEYLGNHRHAIANFRGMSNHTGLTMTKPLKKTVGALYQSMYQSLYPALNIPSLSGGTPERAEHTDSRSDRSDSM